MATTKTPSKTKTSAADLDTSATALVPTRELDSLESLLRKLPEADQREAFRILYGDLPETLPIAEDIQAYADEHDFEVAAYKIHAAKEQRRAPRVVRIGVIQNQIVVPTDLPVIEQYEALADRIETIIHAAAKLGVNVLGLQEAWTMPFAFCTREKQPWLEFAEPVDGPSTQFLQELARAHNMVIVSPILERDDTHGGTIHNTAVVIGNRGNIIGSHRKNHIPRVGDFNESTYYMEGEDGHPVFATDFGNVAINICYGRHHPLNWLMFGINGAEIVFNPSATVAGQSENLWKLEQPAHAVANGYFMGASNRVGTEAPWGIGEFYGNSYICDPRGKFLSKASAAEFTDDPDTGERSFTKLGQDELIWADCDLDLIEEVRKTWQFYRDRRPDSYGDMVKQLP